MKKTAVIVSALLIVFGAFATAGADDGKESSGSDEVVVKGQLKIKIEAEKPEIDVKTDMNDVANEVIKTEESYLSLSPSDIKGVRAGLPQVINEERTDYRPELSFFETQPVFVIHPKMPSNIELEKWLFKVTDPTGATVKKEKGGGGLPDTLEWDGFDNDGKMMKTGAPYMYVLSWMDKAGNPGTASRKKPKIVNAIKYKRDGKLHLVVSNKILFQKKRKERLTDTGKDILREVEDYMKMSNNFPVTIKIASEDKNLAKDQGASLVRVLTRNLKLPKKFFKLELYLDRSVPRNYRTVFEIKS